MPLRNCDATVTCDSPPAEERPAPAPWLPVTAPLSSETSQQLKIVIVGHVDHGKSTLVGRLLHDCGALAEGKLEQLQRVAERRGMAFEWANLMDALQSERDQNITIDTAQIWFRTAQRPYVIIDAPGHKEFLKNMVTGAASADAALLLIDAEEGVQEQSRRHGYLLHMLGVRDVIVLVNKMDLAGYREERFNEIEKEYRDFLKTIGLVPRLFVPISARHGDNLVQRSSHMPWWTGLTVIESLDQMPASRPLDHQPLRFSIQDVYRFDERRILAGRIESGTLKVGDRLLFSPGNKTSVVKSIERWNAPSSNAAYSGDSIGITLTEQIFVERGVVASLETDPPYELRRIKARIFWMGRLPLQKGKKYKLKLATQETQCEIGVIHQILDASTLQAISRNGDAAYVGRHEVAELELRLKRPAAFDMHHQIAATGRFVIVDGYDVCGGGIILDGAYPARAADGKPRSENIYWSHGKVTAEQRARRNGHEGLVLWFTGLSGSGKSTIATELERELFNMGKQAFVLDGDNVRHGLCSDLAFSPRDRKENIRRVGEVSKLFAEAGVICMAAFISPYREDRDLVRKLLPPGRFVEVYVNAPVSLCEQRDPKGLYQRARRKEVEEFTGISAPYEAPVSPEIELRTDQLTVAECVTRIMDHLHLQDADTTVSI